MYDAFLSYARVDGSTLALKLVEALRDRGREVWFDSDDVLPAVRITPELINGIDGSDSFIILVTERSMSPDSVCRAELDHAVGQGKRILPVRRDGGASAPLPAATPDTIRSVNIISIPEGGAFARGLDRLLMALDLDLPWVREHTRLLLRASDWKRHDCGASRLLRGDDLNGAEQWLKSVPSRSQPMLALSTQWVPDQVRDGLRDTAAPTDLHKEFIVASRRQAERDREVVVATNFTMLARSLSERGPHAFPLATRLAIEAIERNETPEGYEVLGHCLQLLPDVRLTLEHKAAITCLAAGPGGHLATGDASGEVRISDAASGQVLWKACAGSAMVGAEFSANGERLVTRSADNVVAVWSIRSGDQVASFPHSEQLSSARISPDGQHVLTSTGLGVGPAVIGSSTVRILDVAARQCTATIEHDRFAGALFHPRLRHDSGQIICSVARDGCFHLWSVAGEVLYRVEVEAPDDWIHHLCLNELLPLVSLTSCQGTVRVHDLAKASVVGEIQLNTQGGQTAFGPRGERLAAIAGDGTVIVWEVDGWTILARVPAPDACTLEFGPDENCLLVGDYNRGLRVWQITPLREICRLDRVSAHAVVPGSVSPLGFVHIGEKAVRVASISPPWSWQPWPSGQPLCLAFDAHRDRLIAGGERPDPTTRWVSASTPRPGFAATATVSAGAVGQVATEQMVFQVRAASMDGWDLVTVGPVSVSLIALNGRGKVVEKRFEHGISHAAVSSTGSAMAVADGAGRGWYWTPGETTDPTPLCGADGILAVAMARGSSTVVARCAAGVVVWDAQSGAILRRFDIDPGAAAMRPAVGGAFAVSEDGLLVATATGTNVVVYDTFSGRLLGRLTHQWHPTHILIHDAVVVSASANGIGGLAVGDLRAWDASGGQMMVEAILERPATTIAFAPDGVHFAVGADDGGIALWRAAQPGGLVGIVNRPNRSAAVRGFSFSPIGDCLYGAAGKNVSRFLWRPQDLISDALRRLTIEPTTEQWTQVAGDEPYRAGLHHGFDSAEGTRREKLDAITALMVRQSAL